MGDIVCSDTMMWGVWHEDTDRNERNMCFMMRLGRGKVKQSHSGALPPLLVYTCLESCLKGRAI